MDRREQHIIEKTLNHRSCYECQPSPLSRYEPEMERISKWPCDKQKYFPSLHVLYIEYWNSYFYILGLQDRKLSDQYITILKQIDNLKIHGTTLQLYLCRTTSTMIMFCRFTGTPRSKRPNLRSPRNTTDNQFVGIFQKDYHTFMLI